MSKVTYFHSGRQLLLLTHNAENLTWLEVFYSTKSPTEMQFSSMEKVSAKYV